MRDESDIRMEKERFLGRKGVVRIRLNQTQHLRQVLPSSLYPS